MKNKIITIVLIILVILCLSLIYIKFFYDSEKDTQEEIIGNSITINDINKCYKYEEGGCSNLLKDIKIGNELFDIKYNIGINEEELYYIELLFDGFNVLTHTSTADDLTLFNLAIIDDLALVNIGDESSSSVELIDKNGDVALSYDYFINEMPIKATQVSDNKILIETSKMNSKTEYDYYNICDSNFYKNSGYNTSDLANANYEITYLGDKKFSEPKLFASETIEEIITRNCN